MDLEFNRLTNHLVIITKHASVYILLRMFTVKSLLPDDWAYGFYWEEIESTIRTPVQMGVHVFQARVMQS